MERLRVDICTNRPLNRTSVAEDSVAQVTHSVRGLVSEKVKKCLRLP